VAFGVSYSVVYGVPCVVNGVPCGVVGMWCLLCCGMVCGVPYGLGFGDPYVWHLVSPIVWYLVSLLVWYGSGVPYPVVWYLVALLCGIWCPLWYGCVCTVCRMGCFSGLSPRMGHLSLAYKLSQGGGRGWGGDEGGGGISEPKTALTSPA
jgi:hypothetical protein